ncbi:protein FAM133B isoform X3 [Onychostruthus taczanowskii]|uniref:protein FAM133B isoform X3 n=1 Tax=Onychostruthus taczanowskii TaxID=356909 RepID=UPI001B80DB3E|nr:protein FAM133B isoform X3 [Onychostruthus taczanowskii]
MRIGGKNWKNTGRNYWVEMRAPPKKKSCLHLPLLHQALILPAVHLIQKMRIKSKGRKEGRRSIAPHGNLQQAQLQNLSQTARIAQKRRGQRKTVKKRRKVKITTGKGRKQMDLYHQNLYLNRIRQRRCKRKRRKAMRKKRKQIKRKRERSTRNMVKRRKRRLLVQIQIQNNILKQPETINRSAMTKGNLNCEMTANFTKLHEFSCVLEMFLIFQ